MSQTEHFDSIAAHYDALRVPPGMTILHDTLVREGELSGKRVLDIGCGTGAALHVLAEEFGCSVAGVDPSTGMLSEARQRLPHADIRPGTAEALPFPDTSFDAAMMMLCVHLLDRAAAFAEAYRILVPAGRLLITTPDPAAFPKAWMAPIFPSYVSVEQSRFPTPEVLADELDVAGFDSTRLVRLPVDRRFSRESALERLRSRVYSTLDHLADEEVREGIARAERELPDTVEYTLELTVTIGTR
ncbi:MAG TPA: methyltransferase domain-containing protein [Gaiellaceae bacterium]